MEIYDTLKLSASFKFIPTHILNEIAKLAELMLFKIGEVVYEIGDKADAIYVILSGSVTRTVCPPISLITQEKIHRPFDVVGWVALFQDQPYGLQNRISKLVCSEDSVLIKIDSSHLESVLEKEPEVLKSLRALQAKSIAEAMLTPGSAFTFTDSGEKRIPRFVPYSEVDERLKQLKTNATQ